jgi:hypothetical protein
MNYVVAIGGACWTYDEHIHDDLARATVFTQMPEENRMLQEPGDVIKIDGNDAPLKINWEIVPITVMDSGRHIQYGVRRFRHKGGFHMASCLKFGGFSLRMMIQCLFPLLNDSPVLSVMFCLLCTRMAISLRS